MKLAIEQGKKSNVADKAREEAEKADAIASTIEAELAQDDERKKKKKNKKKKQVK
jgi:hypothetical protein